MVAGFSSGYMKVFSEVHDCLQATCELMCVAQTGRLMLSQMPHRGPIVQLKLRSCHVSGWSTDETEDLTLLYRGGVAVTVDGLSLYTVLMSAIASSGVLLLMWWVVVLSVCGYRAGY